MMTWIVFVFCSLSLSAQAGTEAFSKAQALSQKGQNDEAISMVQKELKNASLKPEEKRLGEFTLAYFTFQKGSDAEAIALFQNFLKEPSSLEEYARFYIGKSQMKLDHTAEAQKEFEKVLKLAPNAKMRIETQSLLGEISLRNKNFKAARGHLVRLERSTRGTEQYPEIIFNLAQAEKGLRNHRSECKWAKKLYTRYPNFAKVADWGPDLAANELGGKPTDCHASPEDFRARLRSLLWGGLDQKAQAEINAVKEKIAKSDKFLAEQLQAQFYVQEGEVNKALELLKPYYDGKKRNFSFLMFFGSTAARAGEVQLAVGSYYSAYKLNPRSKLARQALYQSAFLGYQFQDYDGAARRFQEFMKVYPTSGLSRDAKWHLAWLKYLKGDYDGSYKAFAHLLKLKKKTRRHGGVNLFPTDRVTYWMAMSLFRQEKYDQAKPLFESLTKDKLVGYYAIAAQARLKKTSELQKQILAKAKSEPHTVFVPPRSPSRYFSSEFMMPSVEKEYAGDDEESEQTLIANQYEDPADEENEEADDVDNPDLKTVEVAETGERPSPFPSGILNKKFEQARDLIAVGMNDWARWDLYDIESKTSNKEYLKTLLSEYADVGSYHRSASIAQIQFGSQRSLLGMDGARNLWEHAYPRAYSEYVMKFSKNFGIPSELVWGIMRAESQYRRDAISPVGALGLMQVMPFTGHKVASLLGDKDFRAPQLLEPEPAIRIGARYLKRLNDTFKDTIPLVAAGYNAGPHRVKSWLANFGTLDTDEFIEHIPYLETRNYVKKVISNCQVYAQLYGAKKELFPYLSESVPGKISAEAVAKENWDDI